VPRTPLPIRFQADGDYVDGETLHCDAGAAVLVLTSCSAGLGLELRSAYIDGEGAGEVLAAESALAGSEQIELGSRRIPKSADALVYRRRHLLYDHLQRLQDLALHLDHELSFEGIDEAAAALDPLSPVRDSV
jgi:hypothetical protein